MEHLSQFISNHLSLWAAFIALLVLILVYEFFSQKSKARQITPQVAVGIMNQDNATVIDIRDKDSFQKGHIIDSIQASIEDFQKAKMDKYKSKPVIIVCTKGIQSQTLAEQIRKLGFLPMVLGGGISAWQAADLPLVKGKE